MARTAYKYTDENKQEFALAVLTNNGNVTGTARNLNIPLSSAKRMWAEFPVGHEIINLQKQQFAKTSWSLLSKILKELSRKLSKLDPQRIRVYKELIDTLYDKADKATQNLSHQPDSIDPTTVQRTISEHSKSIFTEFKETTTLPDGTTLIDVHQRTTPKEGAAVDITPDVDAHPSTRKEPKAKKSKRTS